MSDAIISSRVRKRIPAPKRLRELLRSLAMLDALLEPQAEHRYFSYDPSWGPGEAMGSMRDGQGDWFAVCFPSTGGAVLRGFGHESVMSPFRGRGGEQWPGLFDGLPARYDWALDADGFVADEVTFCLWYDVDSWRIGDVKFPRGVTDPDGSASLLTLFDDMPASYVDWARDYYECELELEAVDAIYATTPLSAEIVAAVAPETNVRAARRAARELGYPVAKAKKTRSPKNRALSAKRQAIVARMKAARGLGTASFVVQKENRTVRMMVHDRAIAEVETDDAQLYYRIFELVKSTISKAKTE